MRRGTSSRCRRGRRCFLFRRSKGGRAAAFQLGNCISRGDRGGEVCHLELHSMPAMLTLQSTRLGRHVATLTIRNVDLAVKESLRVRAARHGRSMEAELRTILANALASDRG